MSTMSRTLTAAVTAASLLAIPTLAAAQPAPHAPLTALPEAPAIPAAKDGGTATTIAVGTTVAGLAAMIAAGQLDGANGDTGTMLAVAGFGTMLVGPAAGHIYAGEYVHALGTTAFRGAAVGAMIGGFAMTLDLCFDVCEGQDDDDALGATLLLGGTAALVGLTAYDLWDAHKAAERTNARHAIRVAPTALATSHGPVAGLAVGGSF